MKKSDEYRSPVLQTRLDEMVEKISKATGAKPQEPGQPPKLGRWAHTQGTQFKSTADNLARQAKGKDRDWDSPIEGWKGDADAERVFREKNKVSVDDISHAQSIRQSVKNELGQSEKSATTPELRASAIHHFEVAGNVKADQLSDKDKQRVTNMEPIRSENPTEVVVKKLTAWQAFLLWLAGGKVWEEKE